MSLTGWVLNIESKKGDRMPEEKPQETYTIGSISHFLELGHRVSPYQFYCHHCGLAVVDYMDEIEPTQCPMNIMRGNGHD
jgi:hypothetical protein